MEKRKGWAWGAASAGAVTALFLLIYAQYGLYPFGGDSIGWGDMKQQIAPLLLQLRGILLGQQDFFLHMQSGGMDFWGVFFFFLSSPFSFLVVLVPAQGVYDFLNILVLLKCAAAAFSLCVCLPRLLPRLTGPVFLAFSVGYAFSGYSMLYFVNVHWLDMMILFPFLALAFLRAVHRRKNGALIAALSLQLVMGFYLGYMVLLFLAIAAGAYVWICVPKPQRPAASLRVCAAVAVSLFLTAGVWVPFMLQYLQSARTTDFILSLQSGSFLTHWATSTCTLFCTATFCAGGVWCAVCRGKWEGARSRRLLFLLALSLLMSVPLWIEPVNKFWHIGSYQAYPSRYGFILVFLWALLAAAVWEKMEPRRLNSREKGPPVLLIAFSLFTLGILVLAAMMLMTRMDVLDDYCHTLWVTEEQWNSLMLVLFFLFCAALLLYGIRRYSLLGPRVLSLFLVVLTLVQTWFTGSAFLGGSGQDPTYEKQLIALGKDVLPQEDGTLHYVKQNSKSTDVNLLGGAGFANLSHYTSLTARSMLYSMKKLGYSGYWMEVGSHGGTLFSDALLGVDSVLYQKREAIPDDRYDAVLAENDEFTLLHSRETWGMGLIVPAVPQEIDSHNRLQVQAELFRQLFPREDELFHFYQPADSTGVMYSYDPDSGIHNYQLETEGQAGVLRYTIALTEEETLYLDLFKDTTNRLSEPINGTLNVFVNGECAAASYPDKSQNGLLDLGTFQAGETVEIEVWFLKNAEVYGFSVAGLRRSVFRQAAGSARGCTVTQSGNRLTVSVEEARPGEWLFLPVQYQMGMRAWCDGEPVTVQRALGAFTAVYLPQGGRTVTLTYWPDGLIAGLTVSLITAAMLGLWRLLRRRVWLRRLKYRLRLLAFPVLLMVSALAFFLAFLFPVGIYLLRAG